MSIYQTPGVYVEEISTSAPSVVAVKTAVPAFIGLTELGSALLPTKISNIDEYVTHFGTGQKAALTPTITEVVEPVTDDDGETTYKFISRTLSTSVTEPSEKYYMYESIKLYFDNGGGPCYVISVGNFTSTLNTDLLAGGLDELEKEDEPTLIVFPDVYALSNDLSIYNQALAQCNKLQDRFLIMDVPQGAEGIEADALAFRESVTSEYVKYGAAYYPNIQTNLSFDYQGEVEGTVEQNFVDSDGNALKDDQDISLVTEGNYSNFYDGATLDELKGLNKGIYNAIIKEANKTKIVLPSSGAVAGVYFQTDTNRGVWKAPANVALTSVSGPSLKITADDQKELNVHSTGKSINAIRSFTGQGTKVWGARTLDGNDNDWRYVNVRRLFNYVEESIQKSTSWAVFEANDVSTHIRVKTQIQNFLTGIWKSGGLAGSVAAEAFFVKVGLGESMTPQDVLEGRMNVEIGLAASRPAEFIVLKFSHIVQES